MHSPYHFIHKHSKTTTDNSSWKSSWRRKTFVIIVFCCSLLLAYYIPIWITAEHKAANKVMKPKPLISQIHTAVSSSATNVTVDNKSVIQSSQNNQALSALGSATLHEGILINTHSTSKDTDNHTPTKAQLCTKTVKAADTTLDGSVHSAIIQANGLIVGVLPQELNNIVNQTNSELTSLYQHYTLKLKNTGCSPDQKLPVYSLGQN